MPKRRARIGETRKTGWRWGWAGKIKNDEKERVTGIFRHGRGAGAQDYQFGELVKQMVCRLIGRVPLTRVFLGVVHGMMVEEQNIFFCQNSTTVSLSQSASRTGFFQG